MAEWKARGYVPDSDEDEEESQELAAPEALVLESLTDIGDGGDNKHGPREEKGTSGAEASTSQAKGQSAVSQIRAVEVRIPVISGSQRTAQRSPRKIEIGEPCLEDEGDIDELQQDHYATEPSTHLQTELRAGNMQDRQTVAESGEIEEKGTWSQGAELSRKHATPSSAASSPLSEPSSLPELSQMMATYQSAQAGHSYGVSQPRDESPETEQVQYTHPQANTHSRSARNLRHRNPIQLHPYAIESEKYRQILHARGLKALRFAQAESQAQFENDTQSQAFETSQASRSSAPEAQRSPRSSPPLLGDDIQPTDDDFPDMDALLRRQSVQYTVHRYKRRKLREPKFKRPPALPARARVPSPEDIHTESGAVDVYDIPPSPPLSSSQTPNGTRISNGSSFRIPPRASPTALPTPVTSSEPRNHPQDALLEQEDEGSPSDKDLQSSGGSVSSAASSEDESANHIQRVQRKIRGVLPASWLKLDLKTQVTKSNKGSSMFTSASPEKRQLHRGVARPVLRDRTRTLRGPISPQEFSTLSDEDSASDTEDKQLQPMDKLNEVIDLDADGDHDTIFVDRLGEAPEEDEIDAMLPSTNRASYRSRKSRRRQKMLSDYGLQPLAKKGRNLKESAPKTLQARRPLVAHEAQISKPKFRPPRLSILDASCQPAKSRGLPTPSFLKIVTRTVRSRRDKGRHSPFRKYLKLATREDDSDANQVLQSWREGSIAPIPFGSTVTRLPRKPLLPRSGNSALPPAISSVRIPALSSAQAVHKPHDPTIESKPRKTQSSLNALVYDQPREDSTRPHEVQQPQDVSHPKNAFSRQGQLISSLRGVDESRPAMLETLQEDNDRANPQTAFSRALFHVAQHNPSSDERPPFWDRFLVKKAFKANSKEVSKTHAHPEDTHLQKATHKVQSFKSHKQRKRHPRHIDLSPFWSAEVDTSNSVYRSPSASLQNERFIESTGVHGSRLLVGLGPFGTHYTSTFDIVPLPQGTCFHQSTFLGSGDFAKSMRLDVFDLDCHRGFTVLTHEQETFRWGPWTEAVASELGMLCESLDQAVRQQPNAARIACLASVQKDIAKYFLNSLSFLDPVDRIPFLQKCMNIVRTMVSDMAVDFSGYVGERQIDIRNNLISTRTFCLVIVNELRLVSQHPIVPEDLKQELAGLMSECFERLKESMESGLEGLGKSSLDFGRVADGSLTIRDGVLAEALVIAQHILEKDDLTQGSFWDTLLVRTPPTQNDAVAVLEQSWQRIFVVLPYLEFDVRGVLETGRRFNIATDKWKAVRKLMSPVLEIYIRKSQGQSPSFNAYCRALFSRCLYLINAWGWRRCDSIIGYFFDFFAQNSLNHLRNEESHGSPSFLEHLNGTPILRAEPGDRCFHLLLKIIGSGLEYMRHIFAEKKIRDLVWRLMPNHGRSHPKEESIRQEDLDALRNHHDLLCTLYWASPPGFRPRLSAIRNLVRVESSHKEACHINIRAWFNLVRFQLSTDEPVPILKGFAEWHDDLMYQLLRQHSLARTEAEEEVNSLQRMQGILVSRQLLESTISRNQRQIEYILSDALTCLHRAIKDAHSRKAVDVLLTSKCTTVFDVFDSTQSQTISPIMEALDVLLLYTEKCSQWLMPAIGISANDDSQEYGDWSAFVEEESNENVSLVDYALLEKVQDPLRHLISNCFGADVSPPDNLLSKIVHVWAAVSQKLVSTGQKSWSDYIGRYGNDAWSSFRDTNQTRKYTPYYLAILIEHDLQVYKHNEAFFLRYWIESLVERESLLKFQHRLTSTLLNADPDHPLLSNPPFCRGRCGEKFDITPALFSERRLSLISGILSNMRTSIDNSLHQPSLKTEKFKQEYRDLLKHLMIVMKNNYLDLGSGTHVKGAYVDFVHRIIEFLQQHTSSICPIDRFFTDSVTFPVPATDPSYVVAQLRNYGLRLEETRAPKELAIFLQSVSERAAIDGQQHYLVGQLHAAMSNNFENGFSMPSLRGTIIKTVLPAYIEMAFKTTCGWLLALPYLKAARDVFNEVMSVLDGCNPRSVESIAAIIVSLLKTIRAAVIPVFDEPLLTQKVTTMKLLRACYRCITALLPSLDYIVRLGGDVGTAIQCVNFLGSFAAHLLSDQETIEHRDFFILRQADFGLVDEAISDVRSFVATELRQALDKSWVCIDGRYYVTRGSSRREVVVDVGLKMEEQGMLRMSVEEFKVCLSNMPALGDSQDQRIQGNEVYKGFEDLVI